MFQFSRFPSYLPIYSGVSNVTLLTLGFPIRTFPDQSLLTAPRDLSQSSTSFFGNIRLGILSMLLSTFLCIDLTSNWLIPMYYLPSISYNLNFETFYCFKTIWKFSLHNQIVNLLALFTSVRTHSKPSNSCGGFCLFSQYNFTILTLTRDYCKDDFCCIFRFRLPEVLFWTFALLV